MPSEKRSQNQIEQLSKSVVQQVSRRKFLGYVGASSALLVTAASCKKDDAPSGNGGVDLGSGDVGVLNYAYALEQLEAAFYLQIIATPYSGMSATEKSYFTDIRNHEVAHREFLKAALKSGAIPSLEVDFSSINFSDKASVLAAAKAFEDVGVSAYNGAGRLLTNPDYLTLAGKIVSVEARHAAFIRELITVNTFADNTAVDTTSGLDLVRTPSEVLTIAGAYIKTKIDASHLPS